MNNVYGIHPQHLLEGIQKDGAIAIRQVLRPHPIRHLSEHAKSLTWRRATRLEDGVRYELAHDVPASAHGIPNAFCAFAYELGMQLHAAMRGVSAQSFCFNKLQLRRYTHGTPDTIPTRGDSAYKVLSGMLVLESGARHGICHGRRGPAADNPTVFELKAGDLFLVRGYDFDTQREPPMRFVADIQREHLILYMRFQP